MTIRVRVVFAMIIVLGSIAWVKSSLADPKKQRHSPKTVYPGKTQLDFEGAAIEGELRNPGEFYFQHKPEDKMDSLVKRRKNFHREMLRDVVLSK